MIHIALELGPYREQRNGNSVKTALLKAKILMAGLHATSIKDRWTVAHKILHRCAHASSARVSETRENELHNKFRKRKLRANFSSVSVEGRGFGPVR